MKKFWRFSFLFSTVVVLAVSSTRVAAAEFAEVKDLPVQKEMPDVLTMNDGTRVTTMAQWRVRRMEMKETLEHYALGHAPPPPGNVSGMDLQTHPVLDGAATFRLVHLKFGPDEKLGLDIAIFTPTGKGPFPTIINPSFFMTPGVNFTNSLVPATGETNQVTTNASPRLRFNFSAPVDPERAARGFTNQLNRGYAIVTYRYTQCGEDNPNFRTNSFYLAWLGVGIIARGGLRGDAAFRG